VIGSWRLRSAIVELRPLNNLLLKTLYKIRKVSVFKMETAKKSIRRQPERLLPTGVQKSYFMLSDAERTVLNKALEKYQPGRSEPIFVGGRNEKNGSKTLLWNVTSRRARCAG
jgi:hypothetical protein